MSKNIVYLLQRERREIPPLEKMFIQDKFSFPRSERATLTLSLSPLWLQVFCLWLTNRVILSTTNVGVKRKRSLNDSNSLVDYNLTFTFFVQRDDTVRKLLKTDFFTSTSISDVLSCCCCEQRVNNEKFSSATDGAAPFPLSPLRRSLIARALLCSCGDDDDYLTDSWDIFMPCYL